MISTRITTRALTAIATAAALGGTARQTLAAGECGAPEPGVEVVCTPASYDPGEDGNIYYAEGVPDGDFSLRLDKGLKVAYRSGDPGDDTLVSELIPGGVLGRTHFSAIVAVPLNAAHSGDITLTSSADVTATGYAAHGYLVGRIGGSGRVALDLREGSIATDGDFSDAVAAHHLGLGDIVASIQGTTIRGQGSFSEGVRLRHTGTGHIALHADGARVDMIGDHVHGIFADHIGTGESLATIRGGAVSVSGNEAKGLYGYRAGEGNGGFALRGAAVTASGDSSLGVHLSHHGLGDLTVDAEGATIDVTGARSRGIFSEHLVTGDILTALRGGAVAASGERGIAIATEHKGTGSSAVDLRDVAVKALGNRSRAVSLEHSGFGDLTIDAEGASASASGDRSTGIFAVHTNEGDVTAVLRDATLETKGTSTSLNLGHNSNGAIRVDAERSSFRTEGDRARAINVYQLGDGDIDIDLRAGNTVTGVGDGLLGVAAFQWDVGDIRIRAEGGSISAAGDATATAVYAQHTGGAEGDVDVDLRDMTVTTDGEVSLGVRISHFGTRGDLSVRLRDTQIAAAGEDSAGVATGLASGNGSIRIVIDGGAVMAEGDGASAVYIGLFEPETGEVTFAADVAADGYRDQTVTVNGRVRGGSGEGAGIGLVGGGRVEIGAGGSVGADSGVAIRALGDGSALRVAADFDGRRPGDVFGGDIRNDAGRTMIVVDGVTLHDPMLGATGTLIPRGARDLTLAARDTVLGRAFAPADFLEPLAPRAAVYETLPDFLFRLAAPAGRSVSAGRSGGFAGLEYGEGSIEAAHTTSGAAYDFERSAVVMSLSGSPGPRFRGWIELHNGEGATEVASPAGAGTLDAVFRGYRAGAAWQGPQWYTSASLASENYLLDVATARRGLLRAGVDARGRSFGIEVGRSISALEGTALVPRAWFTRAEVSAESFVDAVNAAVSLPDAARSTGGIGVEAQLTRDFNGGGTLTYGGFADLETMSGDAGTTMLVDGEALTFEAPGESLAAGLNLNYRRGRVSLDAGVFARTALDTGASEHGARLYVGGLF